MGISYQFMEDRVYSAEDVNTAFSRLVTKGVSFYKEPAALVSMEEAQANPMQKSYDNLNPDACMVIKTETGYKVLPGIIFLNNGECAEIDNTGYSFTVSENKEYYVYAQWNKVMDRADIVVSEIDPQEEGVLLAFIEKNGDISDQRIFAQPRMIERGKNVAETIAGVEISTTSSDYTKTDLIRKKINLAFGGSRLVILSGTDLNQTFIFDVSSGKKTGFQRVTQYNMYNVAFQKKGAELFIFATSYKHSSPKSFNLLII